MKFRAGTYSKQAVADEREGKPAKDEAIIGGAVKKTAKPIKTWFVILIDDEDKAKVAERGTQLKCLQYIAKHLEDNPGDDTQIFLSNGLKIVGY